MPYFLLYIDSVIFRAFGPLVHRWCEWTGTSNFTLSRIVLAASFIPPIVGLFLTDTHSTRLGLLPLIFIYAYLSWQSHKIMHSLEEILRYSLLLGMIPFTIFLFAHFDRGLRVTYLLAWFLLTLMGISLHIDIGFILTLQMLFFQAVHLYIRYHIDFRGGGRIKKALLALRERMKVQRVAPSPA